MSIFFGCVADDFTGASDGASFLVKAGLDTVLINGIPQGDLTGFHGQAAVIALKSRTQERDGAVRDCLAAFQWLKEQGAEVLYFKYCSTFDSTDDGNIGPVIDAVMEKMEIPYTVLCPSLPVNGRTVKDGRLYVNGVLLEKSHMKEHPLTPMRKSRLADLMKRQGAYDCVETSIPVSHALWERIQEKLRKDGHCYVVPDYESDSQGEEIAKTFCGLRFFTGGSGLLEHLGACYQGKYEKGGQPEKATGVGGRTLILAGSCSKMTLEQVETFKNSGGPGFFIDPQEMLDGGLTAAGIWETASRQDSETVFIYSSAPPAEVARAQALGKEKVSRRLEETMAQLVRCAMEDGIRKFVIAGGETSGAALQEIGYQAYRIGNSIAPGVPVMIPLQNPKLRLVLKSGNFGQKDFFMRAVSALEKGG
ncbi:MAG: 3-oxo-tetronate kinase [Blautia sp.]|jgi:uncharacterized protein YgbK (DUF1537 family)